MMIRSVTLVLSLFCATAALSAWAEDFAPMELNGESMIVGPQWKKSALEPIYSQLFGKPVKVLLGGASIRGEYNATKSDSRLFNAWDYMTITYLHIGAAEGWTSPSSSLSYPASPEFAKSISQFCSTHYAQWRDRIACASLNTSLYERMHEKDGADCKTANDLFRAIVANLGIQASTASDLMALVMDGQTTGHVVSVLTIVEEDHHRHTYIIDAGIEPYIMYPTWKL